MSRFGILGLIVVLSTSGLAASAQERSGQAEVDAVLDAARQAAKDHRNAEAAEGFAHAAERAPERRGEWLLEWAEQTTWSGRADRAVPLFRDALALHGEGTPEAQRTRRGLALALAWSGALIEAVDVYDSAIASDPSDLEARIGRARVLSWLERHDDAQREYESVLALQPAHRPARRGLAQVDSWRGRQRAARERLSALLSEDAADLESLLLLAQAEAWMGRPDRAASRIAASGSAPGDHAELARLGDELARGRRPESRLAVSGSEQSDDLEIRMLSFETRFHLGQGRTSLGPLYQRQRYRPAAGPVDSIDVDRPGALVRHRFSDVLEGQARAWLDRIDVAGGFDDHRTLTYDAFLTLWPSDRWRIDAGASRVTFDNETSLVQNVRAEFLSASVDWTPHDRLRATLRLNRGDYSDGNTRDGLQLEAERRWFRQPRVWVGWQMTTFRFDDLLSSGYFNPESYTAHAVTLRGHGGGRRVDWAFHGSAGRENANPGGSRFIWSAGGRLGLACGRALRLEAAWSRFSSATASSGGFERDTVELALQRRW